MNLVEEAIHFATDAHQGQMRKSVKTPYILHPLEVANICATITTDQEVLAAAILHDTVEDTDTTMEELRLRFGERVALNEFCNLSGRCAGIGIDAAQSCVQGAERHGFISQK